jgi:hypothetical protein
LRVIFYVKREDWYPKKIKFGDKIKHTFDTAEEEEGKKKYKEKKKMGHGSLCKIKFLGIVAACESE